MQDNKSRSKFQSTKTFGHDRGYSAVFRQFAAVGSHCSLMHGYALSFRFVFGCVELDERNWVVDFSSRGPVGKIKKFLDDTFDHTVVVAANDPQRMMFMQLEEAGLAKVVVLPEGVGCELTAKYVAEVADSIIRAETGNRCWIESVEVAEHGANSAIYQMGS